jgi:hypothetical protein
MKTKHTPGPWKAKTVRGHENDLVYCAVESEAKPIGACVKVYKEKIHIDGIEAQWNAKLIAASPDLLQSLQEYVDYFKEWEYVLNDEMRAMLNKAEEAIKKAV